MIDTVNYFYGYMVFFYSLGIIISYVLLMWLAEIGILRSKSFHLDLYTKKIINDSPYTPGVSIVAGAYNEEKTIVDNVLSLLNQDYPKFEVVIVNDGSRDKTLEILIEYFSLVEVPYVYIEYIHTAPYRRMLKSTNPQYHKLIVVDKENGGCKADAINAGLNVSSYPYFVNTDVDCVLAKDTIMHCIMPMLESEEVIAVSGVMSAANGCKVEDGCVIEAKPSHSPCALFQTLEYMRSFFVGKMGWSTINAMPNVSGGYGLFKKDIVMKAGGYSQDSLAEDMDMLIRMAGYCCDFGIKYRVVQVPFNCCWTEVPPNLKMLYKQRVRWGSGLIQTIARHRNILFNRKYGRLGMITMPYILIFEFAAPAIECIGLFFFIYMILTSLVHWSAVAVIFLGLFLFCQLLSFVVLFYDYTLGGSFRKESSYLWLMGASLFESFFYHPLIVAFSLKGYFNYLFGKRIEWGEMERKGHSGNKEKMKKEVAVAQQTGGVS